jgi:S1-C subfamily serine protease
VVVLGGDVITRIGTREVQTMDDVHAALGGLRPGQKVEVELKRGGKPLRVTVQLGERPSGTAAE